MILVLGYAPECLEWFRRRHESPIGKAGHSCYVTAEQLADHNAERERAARNERLSATCGS